MDECKGVWVYLEQREGEFESVSLEILGKGRELADKLKDSLTGVLLGSSVENLAQEAIKRGADKVILADAPILKHYTTDAYTKVVAELIEEHKPNILLLGATNNGRDLAGRLAVRVNTGLTAHVVRLDVDENTGLLRAAIPGFGGSILAICKCVKSRPQMATVRPGIFKPLEPDEGRKGEVERVPVNVNEADIRTQILERSLGKAVDITRAEYLAVAGVGTGGDVQLIKKLAELLGGEIGATRPLTDKRVVSPDYLIGSSGYTVRPKLVIAAGVSGAMHFVTGIQDAGTVVAINKDPEALIFSYADYCIVDDLFKVLPAFIAELDKVKGSAGT